MSILKQAVIAVFPYFNSKSKIKKSEKCDFKTGRATSAHSWRMQNQRAETLIRHV